MLCLDFQNRDKRLPIKGQILIQGTSIAVLMLTQLNQQAWHKNDLAQRMSTQEVMLKHTNLCLIISS